MFFGHDEKIARLGSDFGDNVWDVLIIGAGVAGSSTAMSCARRGWKTLLVESKSFPREKVCGGCLNQRAQISLEELGLLKDIRQAGAVELSKLELRIGKTSIAWKIPSLLSIRRSTLDQLLVNRARESGALVYEGTQATVLFSKDHMHGVDQNLMWTANVARHRASLPEEDLENEESSPAKSFRQVVLKAGVTTQTVNARLVIVADGLTRSSLRESAIFHSRVELNSRIGVQAILEPEMFESWMPSRTLQMYVGKSGYVGLSPTDGELVDLAAAIDPKSLSSGSTVSTVVEQLLSDSLRTSVKLSPHMTWRSTPFLTRTSEIVSGERILLIGDSIGYVEPFTGEGMSWALSSSEAVLPFIESTLAHGWDDSVACRWSTWIRRNHISKQKQCRWIARQLRYPLFAAWIVRVCDRVPPLRAMMIQKATT